ncbi:MAG: BatD family protein [Cyclobacteriaceae bacterium]|nr:BatD family protein [Cyclobacteriaceae bacterium]
MKGKLVLSFITIFLGFCAVGFSQNIRIVLGPDNIALNQAFTISVEVQNDRIKNMGNFPEIPGFQRAGQSSSSSTNIINGQYSMSQSVIQNYLPQQEGTFQISPFTINVNGEAINSPGKKVTVGPPIQQRQHDPFAYDPFEDFFGRREPQEFIDVSEDAYLALSVDKNEVYVGEGFTATLGLYVAVTNEAEMQWPSDISEQLAEIKKKLTPANCWEENFKISDLNAESVEVNSKRYRKYNLFQAEYYPLNNEQVNFPTLTFNMIKYKVAKNPSFFSRTRQADKKEFTTRPKTVRVKNLPEHPLKNQVPVGKYRLNEVISSEKLSTGQSFTYDFTVQGEGNISAITNPIIRTSPDFDFYPPNVQQSINRANGKVTGSKSYSYYGIPNEPGQFDLGDYISMVYFDPDKEKYDTLRSNFTIVAIGESKKNVTISSNDLGSFYDIIDIESNDLRAINQGGIIRTAANILIVILLGLTVFLLIKK